MKRLTLLCSIFLFSAAALFAQIPQEEQQLLDNLAAARARTTEVEVDYYEGLAHELSPLFQYYWKSGNFVKCVDVCQEILQIKERLVGRYNESYAQMQANLAQAYTYSGKYEEGRQVILSMLDTYQGIPEIQNAAFYLNNCSLVGVFFLQVGDFENAVKYSLEALELFDKYTVEPMNKCLALAVIAAAYTSLGDYQKAERYYMEDLAILPHTHVEYGKALNNLGLLYYRMGDYNKSLEYFILAYDAKKATLPENHPLHGSSLSNIAIISTFAGDYEKAEKMYFRALEKQSRAQNPREYANTVVNLSQLYTLTGDYERALQYQQEGIETLAEVLGSHHLDYAAAYTTKAFLEVAMGKYPEAIASLQQTLSIQQATDDKHPETVSTFMLLGKAYLLSQDYKNAEVTLKDAMHRAETLLGKQHDQYAEILYLLGMLYHQKGNLSKAVDYYSQSLAAYQSLYSDEHPKYVTALNNLGELYQAHKQYAKAQTCFAKAAQASKNLFVATTDYMSERQRGLFWQTIRHRYEAIYPRFAYESSLDNPDVATFAYDNELFLKGLLLHSSASIHNSITHSGDPQLIAQWDSLKLMNVKILALQENDPSSAYLAQLRQEAEALEKQLTVSSIIFRDNKQAWQTTWQTVQQALADNQVAIEFFVAPTDDHDAIYCALLLRSNSPQPLMIPLCKESQLSDIRSLSPSQIYDYDQQGKSLYQLLWSPILAHVNPGENICFSPAGVLHQLAIEYLPIDSHTTMQDNYRLQRLSSTRELVRKATATPLTSAALYGGIQYDMDGDELLAESERYTTAFTSRAVEGEMMRQGVQYLPGTRKEVSYIHDLLTRNQLQSSLYLAEKGNEESFKSLDGQANHILHVATHGFFWSQVDAPSADYHLQTVLNSKQQALAIDPLSRCGLLLAGANLSLSGRADQLPEGVQDGILTAKEISLLDLSHTQVAVLSACETAAGEVTSEGVFGLQRGLKQAGVQTIIMSLWPVDDAATQLLMQHFYTIWIKNNTDKRQAFQMAQKTLKKQYPDPKFWAGFILLD